MEREVMACNTEFFFEATSSYFMSENGAMPPSLWHEVQCVYMVFAIFDDQVEVFPNIGMIDKVIVISSIIVFIYVP